MIRTSRQSGFTAVELLITLFVAAGFLVASYQLFNLIIKDGGATRSESRAGNVAYDYMRRYVTLATSPCTAQTPLTNSPITVDGLVSANVTVAVSCPVSYSVSTVSRIEVTVKYNIPEQVVKYSTYSIGSSTAVSDNLNGLIGWWKLNGNPNSTINALPGSITGAPVSSTGENGIANNAYTFSGTGQYINAGSLSTLPYKAEARTMCAWGKPNTVAAGIRIMASFGDSSNSKGMELGMSGTSAFAGSQGTGVTVTSIWTVGVWHHVCMTYNGASATVLYVDGTSRSTTAQTWDTEVGNVFIASNVTAPAELWNGAIDDVRIYNRALSGPEILSIYNLGAR